MTEQKLVNYAKRIGGTCDCPFGDDAIVFRHPNTGKWFGLIQEIPAYFYGEDAPENALNVKCPPDIGYCLREEYPTLRAGYHMNKEHWLTVRLDGSIPDDLIKKLIRQSYEITDKK